jgi:hypothetical protein
MKKIKFGFAFLFATSLLFAQNARRVEIPVRNNPDQYAVIPAGNDGMVTFTEAQPGRITFARYDTTLVENWTVESQYNPNLKVMDYTYNDAYLYLLLGNRRSPDYQVLRLSVSAGFAEKFDFYSLKDLDIVDFKATGNDVFLSARSRSEPLLLHVNLLNRKTRVLPAAFKGKTQIQSMEIDRNTGLLNVAFANQYKNDYKIIIKSYGREGEQTKSSLVTASADKRLMTGKLSSLNASEEMVLGTYGFKKSRPEYTQGLYISKLNVGNENPVFTRYYSFTDFKNFFKFQSEKEQARTKKRISHNRKKGTDLKLEYRFVVHDVVERNGEYVVVAEAYYPTYRNNNMYSPFMSPWGFGPSFGYGFGGFGGYGPYGYSPWGSPYRNNQIFDGYQYTHAVVAGFDKQGNLLWDNVLELNDVKLFTLREQVKVSFSGENVILAYSFKGKLKSKIIRGSEVVEAKNDINLDSEYADDRVKKNQVNNIEYWYGNYFLAWGYQRISNTSQDRQVRGTRNVVYCNKVAF